MMKIKTALLLCLMSAAALSLCGAYRSLHRVAGPIVPEEVAARFVGREEGAEYFLRESGGYVAVFAGRPGARARHRDRDGAAALRRQASAPEGDPCRERRRAPAAVGRFGLLTQVCIDFLRQIVYNRDNESGGGQYERRVRQRFYHHRR